MASIPTSSARPSMRPASSGAVRARRRRSGRRVLAFPAAQIPAHAAGHGRGSPPSRAVMAAKLAGMLEVAGEAKARRLLGKDGPRSGAGLALLQRELFPASLVSDLTGVGSHQMAGRADSRAGQRSAHRTRSQPWQPPRLRSTCRPCCFPTPTPFPWHRQSSCAFLSSTATSSPPPLKALAAGMRAGKGDDRGGAGRSLSQSPRDAA